MKLFGMMSHMANGHIGIQFFSKRTKVERVLEANPNGFIRCSKGSAVIELELPTGMTPEKMGITVVDHED